ncbi:MAG: SHOCT domain-containing protein [Sphaerobacteraceae bacterium]|nr:MAG: SHOCT domain-containing protein [Sphaerobacteraceae bacterium]
MPIGPWELAILLFILGGPLLLGVLFVVYLLVRKQRTHAEQSPDTQESALEILDRRYASGEIDSDEYQQRRDHLTGSNNPR